MIRLLSMSCSRAELTGTSIARRTDTIVDQVVEESVNLATFSTSSTMV